MGAGAHIVYGRPSLQFLALDADVVARARVVEADASLAAGAGEQRPVVTVELLEVFKGDARPGRMRFAQHGHGVARFPPGEEVLVFLRSVGRVRELGALEEAGAIDFVSLQEHDAEFILEQRSREALLSAIRAYVRVETVESVEERRAALRRVTVLLLTSGDERLASSALRDLVLASGLPLITAAELPSVEPLLSDSRVSIGLRAGLLAELSRRGLVEGTPAWVRLLEAADADELPSAARAAGAHPSAEITARLVVLLSSENAAAAEAAAIALGHPGHAVAAARLAGCLQEEAPRLRMAAIRGLGHIGSPEARVALELAATSHPDAATRRRAAAEVDRLAGPEH